ncbi:Ankyrin repeat-containing domain protein [Elaphomyces granulatus]
MTNKSDQQGRSLRWGVLKGVEATVQWAIAAGRQQQHLGSPLPECYRHALNVAVGDRNMHLVKLLLEVNGMDVTANIIDPYNSALHLACQRGDTSIVKLLLAKDSIDINLCNKNGDTPLMQAAECRSVPVMESLLARNDLDPNIRSFSGYHVVYPSLSLGYTIVKSLLDHPKTDRDPNLVVGSIFRETGLMRACEIGDPDIVKLYLDRKGIDLNRRDHRGCTALDKAIASYYITRGRLEVIKLLLGQDNIDLNHRDNTITLGRTPLHRACIYGNLLAVDLLLKKKDIIDPNARDNSGATPLTYACFGQCRQQQHLGSPLPGCYRHALNIAVGDGNVLHLVKLLLEVNGIDVNGVGILPWPIPDKNPLFLAVNEGHGAIVKLLLDVVDIDPNIIDPYSANSALHLACQRGDTTIINLLLAKDSIDINLCDEIGDTPLMRAARYKSDMDIVKLYLDRDGIDLIRRDHRGFAALNRAIATSYCPTQGRLEVIKLLLGRDNIDLNYRDNNKHGRTVLHTACAYVNRLAVDMLLTRKDVDPNARDNGGATPLTYACWDFTSRFFNPGANRSYHSDL